MSFDLALNMGDLKINNDGTINTVAGNSKLRQDILKILLTEIGDNKFHPKYGSHIGTLQIGSSADNKLIALDLEASARTALENLVSLQRSQSRRQRLSSGEVILEIINVKVARDTVDPRLYNIFVSVLTQELTEVRSSVTIRIA
jgi:phage baseplate assembly protein W